MKYKMISFQWVRKIIAWANNKQVKKYYKQLGVPIIKCQVCNKYVSEWVLFINSAKIFICRHCKIFFIGKKKTESLETYHEKLELKKEVQKYDLFHRR